MMLFVPMVVLLLGMPCVGIPQNDQSNAGASRAPEEMKRNFQAERDKLKAVRRVIEVQYARYVQAFNAGRINQIMAMTTKDCTWREPDGSKGTPVWFLRAASRSERIRSWTLDSLSLNGSDAMARVTFTILRGTAPDQRSNRKDGAARPRREDREEFRHTWGRTPKGWRLRAIERLDKMPDLPKHVGLSIAAVAVSPDGKLVAGAGGDALVRVWDAQSGRLLRTMPASGRTLALAFSPDGRLLAGAGSARNQTGLSYQAAIRLWDPRTGKEAAALTTSGFESYSTAFSPDGRQIAAGSADGTLSWWDVGARSPRHSVMAHTDRITNVAFSLDGRQLASSSPESFATSAVVRGAIHVWDAGTGTSVQSVQGCMFGLAYSPDGRWLANGAAEELRAIVILRDAASGAVIRRLPVADNGPVYAVAFSPDSRMIAVATGAGVQLWEAATGTKYRTLQDAEFPVVRSIAFTPDGRLLAAALQDVGLVRLWEIGTGKLARTLSVD